MAKVNSIKVELQLNGKNDPVEEKSPTTTSLIEAGWLAPTEAFTSDDLRAYCEEEVGTATQEYDGYGFNISSYLSISKVVVKVEGYKTVATEHVNVLIWDGSTWWEKYVDLTYSEQVVEVDFTEATDWTPTKVNAIKTRIYHYIGPAGCFHPETVFIGHDGEEIKEIKARDCAVGDLLLTLDTKLQFKLSKVTIAEKHIGKFLMVKFYFEIPPFYLRAYVKNPRLKKLFKIVSTEETILAQECLTANHPVFTINKGEILAEQLEVGDVMQDIGWNETKKKLDLFGVQITKIEKFEFEGAVYDIRTRSKWLFTKFLIGFMIKIP